MLIAIVINMFRLAELINQPQQAQRSFWTAKAFRGYISDQYQIQCSYETVVRVTKNGGHLLLVPIAILTLNPAFDS